MLAAGRTGRKGKLGFYTYDRAGKKGAVDRAVYALLPTGAERREIAEEEIQRRLVLAMVNEAARCLEEGILRSPRDGDVGAVFGIGFPPFRGGPFRWVDAEGAAEVVRRLRELEARAGLEDEHRRAGPREPLGHEGADDPGADHDDVGRRRRAGRRAPGRPRRLPRPAGPVGRHVRQPVRHGAPRRSAARSSTPPPRGSSCA